MAGEHTAKFYETVAAFAVSHAMEKTSFAGSDVLREVDLPGVNVRSDIVITNSSGEAQAVFLVTHSRIEVHWAEKFKRDSAEFMELAISDLPLKVVCLILFDARTLPGLEMIAASFLTDVVRIPDLDKNLTIQTFGQDPKIIKKFAKISRIDAIEEIKDIIKNNVSFGGAVDDLIISLRKILRSRGKLIESHGSFFALTKSMVAIRSSAWTPRIERHTRFNRGLSKLALLDPVHWKSIASGSVIKGNYSWAKQPVFWQKSAGKKGSLLSSTIESYRCVDPEVIGGNVGSESSGYEVESVLRALNVSKIASIIERGVQPMMDRYSARIRAVDVLLGSLNYVVSNRTELLKKNSLGPLLRQVSAHPGAMYTSKCGRSPSIAVNWNWLYTAIVALLKAATGKKQGFGYSKISARMTTPRFKSAVEHSILQNFEYCLKSIPEALVDEVGTSLQSYLSDVDDKKCKDLIDLSLKFFVWSEVEDKVIPHGVDVLPAMIEMAAEEQSIALEATTVTSCLAISVNAPSSAGRTNIYRAENTLIWYKAGHYRNNILHKRKEVQSTVAGWRQEWDEANNIFRKSNSFKKLILVIDGDWLVEDMRLLYAYGVDEFIYPDELGSLSERIV